MRSDFSLKILLSQLSTVDQEAYSETIALGVGEFLEKSLRYWQDERPRIVSQFFSVFLNTCTLYTEFEGERSTVCC